MLLNVKTTAATLLLLAMTGAPAFARIHRRDGPMAPSVSARRQVPRGIGKSGLAPAAVRILSTFPAPSLRNRIRFPSSPGPGQCTPNRQKEAETNYPPTVRCKPAGGPAFWSSPGFDIVQVPGENKIYIINIAGPHSWRVVYMDGRPHPKDLRPSYLGHSVGKWEGDTLVIETRGFQREDVDSRIVSDDQTVEDRRANHPAGSEPPRVPLHDRRSRGLHETVGSGRLEQHAMASEGRAV